jgi:transposase
MFRRFRRFRRRPGFLSHGCWQSGSSIDIRGRISKAGDPDVRRRALYEAASALLTRFRGKDKVRTWGLMLAKRSCHHKAAVTVAQPGGDHASHVERRNMLHWQCGCQRGGHCRAAPVKDRKLLGAHACCRLPYGLRWGNCSIAGT